MESVRDNPVTVARSANAVGKSFTAARIVVWFYLVHPDAKVYVAAAPPLENLKKILWGEISSIVRKHPDLFYGHKIKSLDIIRPEIIKNLESFITGVTIPTSGTSAEREGKFSGKHAPHLLFVVDEGDAVPDEVYRGIESCMSGGEARMLIMFNPRARTGPVYFKERNRQAKIIHLSAFNHPNVITGQDVIPGAVTRNITVRRINEWTRPLAPDEKQDHNCFAVPDVLDGYQATALDGRLYPPLQSGIRKVREESPEFWYMVLGLYPTQSVFQLISEEWVARAMSRCQAYVAQYGEVPPPGAQPTLGIDLAEYGPDYNVACPRYGNFVARLLTWAGVDMDMSAQTALKIYKDLNAKIAFVDATGIGSGVAPSMVRKGYDQDLDVRAVSVKVSEKPSPLFKTETGEFRFMRDQLWWMVREWLRTDKGAMLPPDEILREDLLAPEYTVKPNGKIEITSKEVLRDQLKRSPDRGDALCMTFAPFSRPTWISVGDIIYRQTPAHEPVNQGGDTFAEWVDR